MHRHTIENTGVGEELVSTTAQRLRPHRARGLRVALAPIVVAITRVVAPTWVVTRSNHDESGCVRWPLLRSGLRVRVKGHRAWLATVDRVQPGAPGHIEAIERPLGSVTPDVKMMMTTR